MLVRPSSQRRLKHRSRHRRFRAAATSRSAVRWGRARFRRRHVSQSAPAANHRSGHPHRAEHRNLRRRQPRREPRPCSLCRRQGPKVRFQAPPRRIRTNHPVRSRSPACRFPPTVAPCDRRRIGAEAAEHPAVPASVTPVATRPHPPIGKNAHADQVAQIVLRTQARRRSHADERRRHARQDPGACIKQYGGDGSSGGLCRTAGLRPKESERASGSPPIRRRWTTPMPSRQALVQAWHSRGQPRSSRKPRPRAGCRAQRRNAPTSMSSTDQAAARRSPSRPCRSSGRSAAERSCVYCRRTDDRDHRTSAPGRRDRRRGRQCTGSQSKRARRPDSTGLTLVRRCDRTCAAPKMTGSMCVVELIGGAEGPCAGRCRRNARSSFANRRSSPANKALLARHWRLRLGRLALSRMGRRDRPSRLRSAAAFRSSRRLREGAGRQRDRA